MYDPGTQGVYKPIMAPYAHKPRMKRSDSSSSPSPAERLSMEH